MNPKANRRWVQVGTKLAIARSGIDGKGLFAGTRIGKRKKIGELTGELITLREARRRAKGKRRLALVEMEDGRAIDARRGGNEFRYINHSCSPNSYIRICYGRVEFYTLSTITAGQEITCNYGYNHHEGALRCKCGSPNCKGRL